jgi:hypothetical protein
MANLCPLVDCLQIPLDEEYNRILIYSYTDNPNTPYDVFVLKRYNIPEEVPLYLHTELWEWEEDKYIRKGKLREEIIDKPAAKILTEKYLRYIVQTRPEDMNYKKDFNLKHALSITPYYQIGVGCRWNRAWVAYDAKGRNNPGQTG